MNRLIGVEVDWQMKMFGENYGKEDEDKGEKKMVKETRGKRRRIREEKEG